MELSSSATATTPLLQPFLRLMIRRGTFRRLVHVSHKVALCSSATIRPETLCDLGAVYPALQHSSSMLTTQACPPRCLLQGLLLISRPAPTFRPRRNDRDVGSVSDDRGSSVCKYHTRLSKECVVLRGQSQSAIFHRADRQPQVCGDKQIQWTRFLPLNWESDGFYTSSTLWGTSFMCPRISELGVSVQFSV